MAHHAAGEKKKASPERSQGGQEAVCTAVSAEEPEETIEFFVAGRPTSASPTLQPPLPGLSQASGSQAADYLAQWVVPADVTGFVLCQQQMQRLYAVASDATHSA